MGELVKIESLDLMRSEDDFNKWDRRRDGSGNSAEMAQGLPSAIRCYRCSHQMISNFLGGWSLLRCSSCNLKYERYKPLAETIEEWNNPVMIGMKESEQTEMF